MYSKLSDLRSSSLSFLGLMYQHLICAALHICHPALLPSNFLFYLEPYQVLELLWSHLCKHLDLLLSRYLPPMAVFEQKSCRISLSIFAQVYAQDCCMFFSLMNLFHQFICYKLSAMSIMFNVIYVPTQDLPFTVCSISFLSFQCKWQNAVKGPLPGVIDENWSTVSLV